MSRSLRWCHRLFVIWPGRNRSRHDSPEFDADTVWNWQTGALDFDSMALDWRTSVNGTTIFPKLPAYFRSYQTTFNRNVAARSAMDSTKPQHDLVLRLNARTNLHGSEAGAAEPAGDAGAAAQSPAAQVRASPGDATESAAAPGFAGAAELTPILPAAAPGDTQVMPPPAKRARRPPQPPQQYVSTMAPPPPPLGLGDAAVSGPRIVGGTSMRVTVREQVGPGAAVSAAATASTASAMSNHSSTPAGQQSTGKRGKDKKQRTSRQCTICGQYRRRAAEHGAGKCTASES